MVRVGDIEFAAPVFLAPMSGVTDSPFRAQVSRFGAGAVVTEMVASKELATANDEFLRRAASHGGGGPHIVQLVGRDPEWMARAAIIAEEAGADIIDINMGCPARRVTGGQSGCALMREPDLAREMIVSTVKAVSVPVTVKMRLGWDDESINSPDLARMAEGEGVKMLTVHGRTRQQFYNGIADWARISDVRSACSLPLIVNGDIIDSVSARRALIDSGADGVMIGRAVLGRPWLNALVAHEVFGAPFVAPTLFEKLASMIDQVDGACELYGESLGVRVIRKHLSAFIDALEIDEGLVGLSATKALLCRATERDALVAQLQKIGSKATVAA